VKQFMVFYSFCLLGAIGCEDTDIRMATEAGMDAVKAVMLSDRMVEDLAIQSEQ
jgi:hypothetical protein